MEQKRKILFIATEYKEGMRPYALSILKRVMNSESHAVIVIRDKKHKEDFTDFPKENIHFVNYPDDKLSRILFRIYPSRLVKVLNEICSAANPDLIYNLTGDPILANVINRIKRKYVILQTIHDAIGHDSRYKSVTEYLKSKLLVEIPSMKMTEKCSYLITNSREQLNFLKSKYPEKKLFYANFPTLITPAIENGTSIVPELKDIDNYILFFGNIQLYKGVHLLYDIYKQSPELQKYPLVIAGKGNIYFQTDNELRNVYFINRFINDGELKDLFSKAAVTVYPYISATQSGVLSVSSFFGKKMLLSDVPYFRSVADGINGIKICNVNNKEIFTRSLTALIVEKSETYEFYSSNYSVASWDEEIEYAFASICRN